MLKFADPNFFEKLLRDTAARNPNLITGVQCSVNGEHGPESQELLRVLSYLVEQGAGIECLQSYLKQWVRGSSDFNTVAASHRDTRGIFVFNVTRNRLDFRFSFIFRISNDPITQRHFMLDRMTDEGFNAFRASLGILVGGLIWDANAAKQIRDRAREYFARAGFHIDPNRIRFELANGELTISVTP
jgi:hypothetical protein